MLMMHYQLLILQLKKWIKKYLVLYQIKKMQTKIDHLSLVVFGTNIDKIDGDERLFINGVGEGMIWVCNKNGDLDNGDLITSCEVPGYGKLQDDDLMHSYTVAKITQDTNFIDMDIGVTYKRWVKWDGEVIEEAEYDTAIGVSSSGAYKAKFVGCTYHCG